MGFLDNTGVARLWQHILVKVNERLTVDPSVVEEGAANLINADSLGGVLAKDYALKEELNEAIIPIDQTLTQEGLAAESKATGTRITALENNKVESINGLTGKNITLDVGTMGAVLKTGDTMTGNLTVDKTSKDESASVTVANKKSNISLIAFDNGLHGIWDNKKNAMALWAMEDNNWHLTGTADNVTGTVAIANGGTGATDAATARANLGITPENIGALPTRPASIEMLPSTSSNNGGFIDFRFNGSTSDYTSRIIETSSGILGINEHAHVKLGTVTSGIWNGSAIPVANGGTGATDASNARKNLLTTSLKTTDAATTALVQGVQVSILDAVALGTGDPTGGTLLTAANSNNRGMQIANGYSANSLKWRFIHTQQTSDAGTAGYSPWYTIYHSGNINTLMTEITNRLSNASGVSF